MHKGLRSKFTFTQNFNLIVLIVKVPTGTFWKPLVGPIIRNFAGPIISKILELWWSENYLVRNRYRRVRDLASHCTCLTIGFYNFINISGSIADQEYYRAADISTSRVNEKKTIRCIQGETEATTVWKTSKYIVNTDHADKLNKVEKL